ncbi:hypothetical protein [Butyrivibrio sp. FCS014]|uniref:hypothetical protein n=1 Tax=Butyrivibrio sp. FCS014 TaxID=1408304 RepID=UPI0004BC742F|nr:hypothetical protein [Butyrivibrio sp. FCS014]
MDRPADAKAPVKKPVDGGEPIKKKKKIIVVSNMNNSNMRSNNQGGNNGGFGGQRRDNRDNRNGGTGSEKDICPVAECLSSHQASYSTFTA